MRIGGPLPIKQETAQVWEGTSPGRGSLTTMHGPLAPLLFVLAIVFATAFLFMAVTGIMILWALPVIVLSLTFGHRRPAKPGGTPLFRAG